MHGLQLTLLFAACLLFSGCDFDYPIGEPEIKIDPDFLGVWYCDTDQEGNRMDETSVFIIHPLDELRMSIIAFDVNEDRMINEPLFLTGYWIDVEGERYLQIYETDSHKKKYSVVRVELEENKARWQMINRSELNVKAASSEELRKSFIKADPNEVFCDSTRRDVYFRQNNRR